MPRRNLKRSTQNESKCQRSKYLDPGDEQSAYYHAVLRERMRAGAKCRAGRSA
ncbi:hypothetical protein [Kitasatospora sp. NPDC048407]|uniref:hypothetical protein n=1 Tax=Kitasatospora sp. NPDC048407 TaxID=3364051 RepID=UPI0037114F55